MRTPTTVLLVVIAALLAANLFVNLPAQEARAQLHRRSTDAFLAPRVIQVVQPESAGRIYRLWSDGVIESTGYDPNVGDLCIPEWCPSELVPDDVPPQPGARIVQITANSVQSHPTLARVWSNGVVERTSSSFVGEGGNNCIPSESWCSWQAVPE